MSQQELLTRVVGVLDGASIEYMITGSTASSLLGEPRATHDLDLVVALRSEHVAVLVAAFPAPDFYLSEEAAAEAVRERSMFNLLHPGSGDKVDFWLLTSEPFDVSRFARRQAEDLFGHRMWVSSPEDTILAKLRWARLSGGSEKQFVDALRVYELQYPRLEHGYLEHWATTLDVGELLDRLRDQAEPLAD